MLEEDHAASGQPNKNAPILSGSGCCLPRVGVLGNYGPEDISWIFI